MFRLRQRIAKLGIDFGLFDRVFLIKPMACRFQYCNFKSSISSLLALNLRTFCDHNAHKTLVLVSEEDWASQEETLLGSFGLTNCDNLKL